MTEPPTSSPTQLSELGVQEWWHPAPQNNSEGMQLWSGLMVVGEEGQWGGQDLLYINMPYACMLSHFSCAWLPMTLWTVAHQASLSMGFSRQEYWSGMPCPPPGDLPNPGIEPMSLMSPELAGRFFTTSTTWETAHLGNRKTSLGNLNNTYESKTSIKSLKTPLRKMHFDFSVDIKVCLTHFLISLSAL